MAKGSSIDFSQFRKVSSDGKTATLQHPQGHQITIALGVLSPKLRKQMEDLPVHKKDGGTSSESLEDSPDQIAQDAAADSVPAPTANTPSAPSGDSPQYDPTSPTPDYHAQFLAAQQDPLQSNFSDAIKNASSPLEVKKPNPGAAGPGASDQSGSAPPTNPGTQNQGTADPFGVNAQMNALAQGIQQETSGEFAKANAAAALGAAQAKVLNQNAQNQQNLGTWYQDHYNKLDAERQNVTNDILNNHIDPHRYINSMSTGDKIHSAIGLALSGGFGAVSGAGNTAYDMLQKNIERDIDAQKTELGAKKNVLEANLKQFGNLHDAADMTRVINNEVVKNQLMREAAKNGGQAAMAQAYINVGKLNQQNAAILGQLAMRKTLVQGLANGSVTPDRVVMMMPEQVRPQATKELTAAMTDAKVRDNLLANFDRIAQLNTVGNRLANPIQSKREIDAIIGQSIPGLAKESAGRFNAEDAAYTEKIYKTIGSDPKTINQQRQLLLRMVNEKMNYPTISPWINTDDLGRYNSQGVDKFALKPRIRRQ